MENFTLEKCPRCGNLVEVGEAWEGSGECSNCGNTCYWDEAYNDDDFWPVLDWDYWRSDEPEKD